MPRLRLQGLADVANILLKDRLNQQATERESNLVKQRQLELAQYNREQIAQQSEAERLSDALRQLQGDPSARIAETYIGSGINKLGDIDLQAAIKASEAAYGREAGRNKANEQMKAEVDLEKQKAETPIKLDFLEKETPILAKRAGQVSEQQGLGTERATAASFDAQLGREKRSGQQQNQLRLQLENQMTPIMTQRAGQTAEASARAQQNVENTNPIVGPIAAEVVANPAALDKLTPSMRAQVIKSIREAGGQLGKARDEAVGQTLLAAKQTLKDMKGHSGFQGAVGAKGPSSLFGWKEEPMGGTAAASYAQYVSRLQANLTLPRLQFLVGLGHMSDREFGAVAASVANLNRNMREVDFQKELKVIEQGVNNALIKAGMMTPEQAVQETGGDIGMRAREIFNAR